jgi:hypothetical protein
MLILRSRPEAICRPRRTGASGAVHVGTDMPSVLRPKLGKPFHGNTALGYRAIGGLKTAHFAARGLSEKSYMGGNGSDAK